MQQKGKISYEISKNNIKISNEARQMACSFHRVHLLPQRLHNKSRFSGTSSVSEGVDQSELSASNYEWQMFDLQCNMDGL